MRFISWNVNGLRACVNKGFEKFFTEINADIFAIQETKMQNDQLDLNFEGYHKYFYSAEKKGYSGTAIYTKLEPIKVEYGINVNAHPLEGRVITLEFENFYFVCAYVPNAQDGLARIDYREFFEDDMRLHLMTLDQKKPVIYCGDLNVAHNEIDLKNPKSNRFNPGFSDQERAKFSQLLASGFIDTYRYLYPEKIEYSWWSYRFNARNKNIGWRIDYFVVSDRIKDKLLDSKIYTEVLGSDHCPVGLEIDI